MSDQLYRHLSECPGCGASLGRCTSGIREKGAIACCPDCKHEVPVEIDYEAAKDEWRRMYPCVCTVEYKERQMIDPRCQHHEPEVAVYLVNAACGIEGGDDDSPVA